MHTAIQIFKDNYIHIFHTSTEMIAFDCAEPKYVEMLLEKNIEKNFYLSKEVEMLKKIAKRKFLGFFTTHSHFDHSAGDEYLKRKYNKFNLRDGENIQLNSWSITATHIPFHTADSYHFRVEELKGGIFHIWGDILFFLGCGKNNLNDFSLMKIGFEKIKLFEEGLCLYGHDYNQKNFSFTVQYYDIPERLLKKRFLTLKEEFKYNPFFNLEKTGKNLKELRKLKDDF